MKTLKLNEYGNNTKLNFMTSSRPEPRDNEVLVKVFATSINPIDWKVREGHVQSFFKPTLPFVLGWDVAGEIVETGKKISNFQINDKIYAMMEIDPSRSGAYAEYIILKENEISHMPQSSTFEEAASVPLAGLTAWQALFEHGELERGQKVLIQAGAGGVGHFAIQIAKSIGAIVYSTASVGNHDFLKSLGADFVIDYKDEKSLESINELDLVLNSVGGQSQLDSVKGLKYGAKIVTLIGLEEDSLKLAESRGIQNTHMLVQPSRENLNSISKLIDSKIVFPHVQEVLSFDEIPQALNISQKGRVKGKIVIKM